MSPIFEYAADLYREMRAEWHVYLESEYAAAERGAHGSMLSQRGKREGIDPYSLLTGPWSRVEAYASPELIEWFNEHGRPSPSQFEREWMTSWLGEDAPPEAETVAADGYDWLAAGTTVQTKLQAPDGWPVEVVWPALQVGKILSPPHGPEALYCVEFTGIGGLYIPRSALVVT